MNKYNYYLLNKINAFTKFITDPRKEMTNIFIDNYNDIKYDNIVFDIYLSYNNIMIPVKILKCKYDNVNICIIGHSSSNGFLLDLFDNDTLNWYPRQFDTAVKDGTTNNYFIFKDNKLELFKKRDQGAFISFDTKKKKFTHSKTENWVQLIKC